MLQKTGGVKNRLIREEEGKDSSLREWQKQGSDIFLNFIMEAFKYIYI